MNHIKIIQENKKAIDNFINSLSKERSFETKEISCVLTNIKNEAGEIMYSIVTDSHVHNATVTEIQNNVLNQHRITKIEGVKKEIEFYQKSLNKAIEWNETDLQDWYSLKLTDAKEKLTLIEG